MSTRSFTGSPRFKKWTLLIVSLIAAAVWIRNWTVLIPSREREAMPVVVDQPPAGDDESRVIVSAAAFENGTGWQDPFVAPFLQNERTPKAGGDKPNARPSKPLQLPAPPPWKLAGIVWDAKAPSAVFSSLDGQTRLVVAKGDSLGEYLVAKIKQSTVLVRRGKHTWELSLDERLDTPARR